MKGAQLGIGWASSSPVGVVGYSNRHGAELGRLAPWNAIGIRYILEELGRPWVPCEPEEVDRFDVSLVSLQSVTDQLSIMDRLPLERRSRVIVGGQGAYAVRSLIGRVDAVAFGRCEDTVSSIVSGDPLPHVWEASRDPDLTKRYSVRRLSRLLPGEVTVGCKHRCAYCQYTWTRDKNGTTYSHGSDLKTPESTFVELANVVTRPGRYTAALDGFSFESRKRAKKGITSAMIVRTLRGIAAHGWTKPTVIKVFQIAGYPWESESTMSESLRELRDVCAQCDTGPGRIVLMFLVTPFSPEPLTPMELEPASWIDWHAYFSDRDRRAVYSGKHLEAFVLPQIQVPWTLAKRVALNRGRSPDEIRAAIDMTVARKSDSLLDMLMGRQQSRPLAYLE